MIDHLPRLIGGPRDGEYVAHDPLYVLILPALTDRGLVGHRYIPRDGDFHYDGTQPFGSAL